MSDAKRVKHHGFAHLVLTALLFVLAVFVFGGWTQGPLASGLFLGAQAYALVAGTAAGDVAGAAAGSAGLLALILLFVVNLIIYYILAAILIFLINLLFGKSE